MSDNSQILIRRLVDGELNRAEIRQLLNRAENDVELYRQLALLMVEDQLLRREIGAMLESPGLFVAEPPDTLPGDPGCSHATLTGGDGHGFETNGTGHAGGVFRDDTHTFSRPRFWRHGATFFATAAAMLLMTWLGYRAGFLQQQNRRGADPELAGVAAPLNPHLPSGQTPGPDSSRPWDQYATHHLQLVSNEGEAEGAEEVPVIPLSLAREMGLNWELQPVPVDVQRQYNRQGMALQPEVQYMRGRLNDGRQVVVPIQYIRAQAWGQ